MYGGGLWVKTLRIIIFFFLFFIFFFLKRTFNFFFYFICSYCFNLWLDLIIYFILLSIYCDVTQNILILNWVDGWFYREKINFIIYKKIKNERTRLKARERCSLFQPNTVYLAPIVEKKNTLRIFSISILVSSVWELYVFIQNIIMFMFRPLFKRKERKLSGKKKEGEKLVIHVRANKKLLIVHKFHSIKWVLLIFFFFFCWEKVNWQREEFFFSLILYF